MGERKIGMGERKTWDGVMDKGAFTIVFRVALFKGEA